MKRETIVKKVKILGKVIVLMLLGVLGLMACTENLVDYKATKTMELQDYADSKDESNYCTNGWTAICNIVTQGKIEIEEATNKTAVNRAVTEATDAIDEVPQEENMGTFYSLQKAYDDGLLMVEDLRSIAYYQSGGKTLNLCF